MGATGSTIKELATKDPCETTETDDSSMLCAMEDTSIAIGDAAFSDVPKAGLSTGAFIFPDSSGQD